MLFPNTDPQYLEEKHRDVLYNRRRTIELDLLESQITSGWKYKEDALVNPKDVFLAGQGKGLALKDTAQMTDVEQIIRLIIYIVFLALLVR